MNVENPSVRNCYNAFLYETTYTKMKHLINRQYCAWQPMTVSFFFMSHFSNCFFVSSSFCYWYFWVMILSYFSFFSSLSFSALIFCYLILIHLLTTIEALYRLISSVLNYYLISWMRSFFIYYLVSVIS